jgi:hypothetical protein
VDEHDLVTATPPTLTDKRDQACESLPRVNRIEGQTFQPAGVWAKLSRELQPARIFDGQRSDGRS